MLYRRSDDVREAFDRLDMSPRGADPGAHRVYAEMRGAEVAPALDLGHPVRFRDILQRETAFDPDLRERTSSGDRVLANLLDRGGERLAGPG